VPRKIKKRMLLKSAIEIPYASKGETPYCAVLKPYA